MSPDGTRVAVECNEPSTSPLEAYAKRDFWMVDLTRDTAVRLTTEGSAESDPVRAPDGSRIALTPVSSAATSDTVLSVTAASGGSAAQRLLESVGVYSSSWWPGRYLVYMDGRTSEEQAQGSGVQWGDLYLLDDAGKPRPLVTSPFSYGFAPGQPTPLFRTRVAGPLTIGLRYASAVAQGGQRFLMFVGEPSSSLTVVVNATSEQTQTDRD